MFCLMSNMVSTCRIMFPISFRTFVELVESGYIIIFIENTKKKFFSEKSEICFLLPSKY